MTDEELVDPESIDGGFVPAPRRSWPWSRSTTRS